MRTLFYASCLAALALLVALWAIAPPMGRSDLFAKASQTLHPAIAQVAEWYRADSTSGQVD